IVPGMDSTKTLNKWKPEEIVRQVNLTRKQRGAGGNIFWNMKSLMRSTDLAEALQSETYAQPALVPPAPWLDGARPGKPVVAIREAAGSKTIVSWKAAGSEPSASWIVQSRTGGKWRTEIVGRKTFTHALQGAPPEVIAVTAVGRNGNTSSAA